MSYSQIEAVNKGAVARILLNRPDKLNAWTNVMEAEMAAAIRAAEADGAIRAIVITGAGRGFCAGADMNLLSDLSSGEVSGERAKGGTGLEGDPNFTQKFSWMLQVKKPIFAAINGPVAGIGLCMALFADFRYMAASARLTTAFARRGLIAEHGMSWMLPKLVGFMNASDLLFSGRLVGAEEAGRMGLVRPLPDEGFLEAVEAVADEMTASSSPRSIGVMKRQMHEAQFQSLAEAWAVADREMVGSFTSEDFREGVAHFLEKRPPRFTGR